MGNPAPARRAVGSGVATATLEEVDIRAEFLSRRPRQADHEKDDRALMALAKEMAANPANMLQKLVETAVELCSAGTAGVSLLQGDVFRWEAVAGVFASARTGTMPRAASPCGVCIDRDATQLMNLPDRCFPALLAEPRFVEALLIPFHSQGKPVGTVWIVSHDAERKFDASDERIMSVLSQLASAGWQLWKACESAAESSRPHKEEFFAKPGQEPRDAPDPVVDYAFSTKQTARILGVGEATVKRLTDDGKLHCLTSSTRSARKFVPEQLMNYLRGNKDVRTAAQAIAAADLSSAIGAIFGRVMAGERLEALLDELEQPLRVAPETFAADLLSRVWAITPERIRPPGTALVAGVGKVDTLDLRLVASVVRSHGYEVLQPTQGTGGFNLVALAERIRPEFSVIIGADAASDAEALAAADQIALHRRDGTVCVATKRSPPAPRSVTLAQSLTALGKLLLEA